MMDSDSSEYDFEVDSVTEEKLLESELEDFLDLDPNVTIEENLNQIESKPKETNKEAETPKIVEKQPQNQFQGNYRPQKKRFNFNRTQPKRFNHQKRFKSNNSNKMVQPWAPGVVQPWASGVVPGTVFVPTFQYIPISGNYHGGSSFPSFELNNTQMVNQRSNSILNKNKEIKGNNPYLDQTGNNSNTSDSNKSEDLRCLIEEQKKLKQHIATYQQKKKKLLQELKKPEETFVPQRNQNNFINTNYQKNNDQKQNFNQNYSNYEKINTINYDPNFGQNTVQLVKNQNCTISSPKSITIQVRNNKRFVQEEKEDPIIDITKIDKNGFIY